MAAGLRNKSPNSGLEVLPLGFPALDSDRGGPMVLCLQPVCVATGLDKDGVLVFADNRLVAVLVQLSEVHEPIGVAGQWFLETSYGLRLTGSQPIFPDLDAAQDWIRQHFVRGS